MSSAVASPVAADCVHGLPTTQCRYCQMVTFLLVRQKLREDGLPFLLGDVCTIILSKLPHNTPPVKDGTWRLKDCGPRARISLKDQLPFGAICGVEFRTPYVAGVFGRMLYCTSHAIKMGCCGYWTCGKHMKRENIDVKKFNRRK